MEVKKIVFVVGISLVCLFAIPLKSKKSVVNEDEKIFKNFMKKFNKTYDKNETEYLLRFENFKSSVKLIHDLNKNRSSKENAYYGLTPYSDLSQEEFINTLLNLKGKGSILTKYKKENDFKVSNVSFIKDIQDKIKSLKFLPERVDWREKGVIGKVHNQRTCGACWAFSTIETMEAMNAIKTGNLVSLSVQQMIDCAKNGNHGCEGGDTCSLLQWLLTSESKVTTETLYPTFFKTKACTTQPKIGVQIETFSCDNFVGSEQELMNILASVGPVVAAVNALNWQFYLGGIIQFHCSGDRIYLNHAVQIVGFDTTGPVPFYIVRNSWGTEFGDNGYLYVAIGNNICGIANEVSSLKVL